MILDQVCSRASSRIPLIVESEAPSGLSRATSRACATVADEVVAVLDSFAEEEAPRPLAVLLPMAMVYNGRSEEGRPEVKGLNGRQRGWC